MNILVQQCCILMSGKRIDCFEISNWVYPVQDIALDGQRKVSKSEWMENITVDTEHTFVYFSHTPLN